MSNNSENPNSIWAGAGIFVPPIVQYLSATFGWNFVWFLIFTLAINFWFFIFTLAIIWLFGYFFKKEAPNNLEQNSQGQSSQEQSTSPGNQSENNSTSFVNVNSQTIEWTEIGTYSSSSSQVSEQNHIKFSDSTDNIEELISNLIGQKDRVTGDVFNPGEKVYFCIPCQLGYHEDSWQFLDKKCEQCKSPNANIYTLTIARVTQQSLNINKSYLFGLDYLMSQLNQFNDNSESINLVKHYNYKLDAFDEELETVFTEIVNCSKRGQSPPIFKRNNRGIYRIIDNKFLVPKINVNPNLSTVFEYINYGDIYFPDNFILLKPAKIKFIENHNEWQLKERGIILFEIFIEEFINKIKNNSAEFSQTSNVIKYSRNELAQEYINALDLVTIRKNDGNAVLIKGQIRSVRVDKYNIIYLDFSENIFQGFYAYILKGNNQFPSPTNYNYEGKNVIISGRLTLNQRNQPRIRLKERFQLTEIET